jgi:flagellar operon protein
MDSTIFNRYPITTGTGQIVPISQKATQTSRTKSSFEELLQQQLDNQNKLTFSKHATQRVEQRGVEMSQSNLARLYEGARIAQEKGLDDTLILVDNTAFLVSVRNATVITTVNNDDLRGSVFTNIDGTVII